MNSRRMSQSALRRFPAATRQLLAAMRRQDVAMGASAHAHGYNMPSRWDFRRFPIDKNAPRTRIATFSILTWRLPILYLLPKS